MTKVILHNPSNSDIIDYRIEEIRFNEDGSPMLDKESMPMGTGRTLEWSLKAGETLEFPEYVADYLIKIYSFLKVTGAQNKPVETATVPDGYKTATEAMAAKPSEGSVNCKVCGVHFKSLKAIGLHFAARHPEILMNG